MASNERSVTIKTSTIIKVIGVLVSLWLLWLVRDIVALLVVALFLAALMHPAVRWAAKKKIPKGVMVILIYIFLFGLLAASFALIVPTLAQQIGQLSETIGSSIAALSSALGSIRDFSQRYGLIQDITDGFGTLQANAAKAAGGIFVSLTGVFGGLIGLVLVLVMAFYMVVEEEEAARAFHSLVPKKYQEFITTLLTHVEAKISRWLLGQLAVSFLIGVMYFVGLLALGLKGALALALFAAFTEFIPYLGPILGGVPIVLVALSVSPATALLALILVVVIQQLENQVVVPKLMQKAVGLNPLVSIVALLVGAQLFGIVGALFAIPAVTALSVVLHEIYQHDWSRA